MAATPKQSSKTVNKHFWRNVAKGLWVVVAIISVAILLYSLTDFSAINTLSFGSQSAPESSTLNDAVNILNLVLSFSAAILSISLAGLIYWRKRNENMALYVSYFLLLYGAIMTGPLEAIARQLEEPLIATLTQGILMTMFLPLIYTFPNGRFVPSWSKWLVVITILITPPMMVLSNDVSQGTFSSWGIAIIILLMSLLLVGFSGQIFRYRKVSSNRERLQTKWVVYGLGLWILFILISTGPYYYLATIPADEPIPAWARTSSILWWFSLVIIPISFGVALLRHKLWDIDNLINRTLVYSLLTGLLLLTYVAFILMSQSLFVTITGQESPLAVVISTLVIAALFQPLRRRVQGFIDRRFYRHKYDKVRTLAEFAQRARDEVDLEELSTSLLKAVQDTVQPESLSLWLRGQDARSRIRDE